MHTLISCSACRQQMRLPPSYIGKKVQCPQCGVRFTAQLEPDEFAEVELVEEPAASLQHQTAALSPVEPEPLWVESAEEEETRQAGPLRLRKQTKKPVPKPGRWPIYLFLAAFLPLGLPLLALGAAWVQSQEHTAGLLLWSGAAVVLTGLCLAITLPGHTSTGVRLAGSLTLSFFAYLVGGVVLLVGTANSNITASEWRPVFSPEDQFTVKLPGFVSVRPSNGPLLGGRIVPGRRHEARFDRLNAFFSVESYPTPAHFRPDQFLMTCRMDVNREYGGAMMVNEHPVFVNGIVGRELTLRQGPNHHVVVRYLATPQRVYILTIASRGRPIAPPIRDQFFNSFIAHAGPQPGPWQNPPPNGDPPPVPPPPTLPRQTILAGGEVRALAFAPDGRQLAVAAEGQGVTFWDTNTGGLRARAALVPVNVVTGASYSPDGRTLAVGGGDGTVQMLDAQTGRKVRTYEPWAGQPVAGFAFSPDGKWLAAASGSAEKAVVRVWDLATGEGRDLLPQAPVPPGTIRYQAVAFTPESARLFVAAYEVQPGKPPERVDRFHDVQTGVPGSQPLIAYRTDRRIKARLSPDSRHVAYFTHDTTVRLWDTAANRETAALGGHPKTVSEIAFSADSSLLASVSTDGTVKLWDLRTRQERASFLIRDRENSTLGKLAFSADGSTLATAIGRKVSLWEVARLNGKSQ